MLSQKRERLRGHFGIQGISKQSEERGCAHPGGQGSHSQALRHPCPPSLGAAEALKLTAVNASIRAIAHAELVGDSVAAQALTDAVLAIASASDLLGPVGAGFVSKRRDLIKPVGTGLASPRSDLNFSGRDLEFEALVKLIKSATGLAGLNLDQSGSDVLEMAIPLREVLDAIEYILRQVSIPERKHQVALGNTLLDERRVAKAHGDTRAEATLSRAIDILYQHSDESPLLLDMLMGAPFYLKKEIVVRLAEDRQGRLVNTPISAVQVDQIVQTRWDRASRVAGITVLETLANAMEKKAKRDPALAKLKEVQEVKAKRDSVLDELRELDAKERQIRQTARDILLDPSNY